MSNNSAEMKDSTDMRRPGIQNAIRGVEGNDLESLEIVRHKGLTIPGAVVFIIGGMAGSGILALPKAVDNLGRSESYRAQRVCVQFCHLVNVFT
jgi:hypothetical protein